METAKHRLKQLETKTIAEPSEWKIEVVCNGYPEFCNKSEECKNCTGHSEVIQVKI